MGLDMYVCREAARGVVVGKEIDLNEAKNAEGRKCTVISSLRSCTGTVGMVVTHVTVLCNPILLVAFVPRLLGHHL